jgi:putative hydrolase of the HAD superfamily
VIKALLFDLDNTLYPVSSGIEERIVHRMTDFTAAHLGLAPGPALAERREALKRYGTTVEWLMAEHAPFDTEGFYAAVHRSGDEDCLEPDGALRDKLAAHPAKKWIFTNSPMEHAERVLERLGLRDSFEGIFDIRFSRFRGKPAPEAFARVLSAIGLRAEEAAFFDDSPRSVAAYIDLGGRGVLVDNGRRFPGAALPTLADAGEFATMLNR